MSNYGPASVYSNISSDAGASTALTFGLYLHKVVLYTITPGTAAGSLLIYNATTASGAILVALSTLTPAAASNQYAEANFDPPVPFDFDGLSTTLVGSSGFTYKLYYTRL